MMLFECGPQAGEDFDGIVNAWLVDVNLLEPAQQRTVFFEMVAEFLVRRRTDAANGAAGQSRLQQVGRIHRAAAGCARADDRMDFVNKQYRVGQLFEFGHHGL